MTEKALVSKADPHARYFRPRGASSVPVDVGNRESRPSEQILGWQSHEFRVVVERIVRGGGLWRGCIASSTNVLRRFDTSCTTRYFRSCVSVLWNFDNRQQLYLTGTESLSVLPARAHAEPTCPPSTDSADRRGDQHIGKAMILLGHRPVRRWSLRVNLYQTRIFNYYFGKGW